MMCTLNPLELQQKSISVFWKLNKTFSLKLNISSNFHSCSLAKGVLSRWWVSKYMNKRQTGWMQLAAAVILEKRLVQLPFCSPTLLSSSSSAGYRSSTTPSRQKVHLPYLLQTSNALPSLCTEVLHRNIINKLCISFYLWGAIFIPYIGY